MDKVLLSSKKGMLFRFFLEETGQLYTREHQVTVFSAT